MNRRNRKIDAEALARLEATHPEIAIRKGKGWEGVISMEECGEILGIKPATVRYHLMVKKNMPSVLVNGSCMVCQTDLKAFIETQLGK